MDRVVEFSLDQILDSDPLGLLAEPKSTTKALDSDERLLASFEEVNRFVEQSGKEPQNSFDINERNLYSRLQGLRENLEKISLLKPHDRFNLLKEVEINSIEDILANDILGVLGDSEVEDIFTLKHIPMQKEQNMPEYIASRKPCEEFDQYEHLFVKVQEELRDGVRKLAKFKNEQHISKGHYFIVKGVLLYVADMGRQFKTNGKKNARLRLIFENGTESDMLLRSLAAELYKDGKSVSEHDETNLGGLYKVAKDDKQSGYIYVLASKSQDDKISTIKNLYKIGYSSVDVNERIKNATSEPTYLMSPVEVVAIYETYNLNAQKFEQLIHKFFAKVCLSVDVFGDDGKRYTPREWFVVPIEIIDQAIGLIISGEILDYRYDEKREELVLV